MTNERFRVKFRVTGVLKVEVYDDLILIMAMITVGLNKPPLIRKNTKDLTTANIL
jgi:hypothetical protein